MAPHDFTANNNTKRVLWVFGYGSLVWKPDFEFTSRKIGYLKGYVRRFWQGNVTHRGVPGRPARVATLVKEDSGLTWGVSFKLEGEKQILNASSHLNMRECLLGGYAVHDLPVITTDGAVHQALVFVATPECELYMGPSDLESMAKDIVLSNGKSGPNTEYLFRLTDFMRECVPDAEDEHLYDLDAMARKLLKCNCSLPNSITSIPHASTKSSRKNSNSSPELKSQYYECSESELVTVLS